MKNFAPKDGVKPVPPPPLPVSKPVVVPAVAPQALPLPAVSATNVPAPTAQQAPQVSSPPVALQPRAQPPALPSCWNGNKYVGDILINTIPETAALLSRHTPVGPLPAYIGPRVVMSSVIHDPNFKNAKYVGGITEVRL